MICLRNIPIIYYIAYIMYYVFATIFSDIPVVGPICLMVTIVISIGILMYAIFEIPKPLYLKVLIIFFFYLSVYGAYLILSGETIVWMANGKVVENSSYLMCLYASFLPILTTYVFVKKKWVQEKDLNLLFWIFFILSIIVFIDFNQKKLLYASIIGSSATEFTNETSYLFLAIFPFIILFAKKNIIQYAVLVCIVIFELVSFKRGVYVCGFLCLAYFFHYSSKQNLEKKLNSYLLISSFVVFFSIFCYNEYQSSPYLQQRINSTQQASSSGRDVIYNSLAAHYFDETSAIEFLIGNGANGTLKVAKTFAHNDWLAILTEQGLLGLLFYTFYWYSFLLAWKNTRNKKNRFVIGSCFIASLGKSLFSMYYLPISPNMQCSSFFSGVVLGAYLAKSSESFSVEDYYG